MFFLALKTSLLALTCPLYLIEIKFYKDKIAYQDMTSDIHLN